MDIVCIKDGALLEPMRTSEGNKFPKMAYEVFIPFHRLISLIMKMAYLMGIRRIRQGRKRERYLRQYTAICPILLLISVRPSFLFTYCHI
jgi:hypothetical protein